VSDGEARGARSPGKTQLDFAVSELASRRQAPMARRAAKAARRVEPRPLREDWYELRARALRSPPQAMPGMPTGGRSSLDAHHADAHVNLGRLLHEQGLATEAERHYRAALSENPEHATAAYNLGIAFEDLDRPAAAIEAYRQASGDRPDPRRRPFQPRAACTRRRASGRLRCATDQQLPATGPDKEG